MNSDKTLSEDGVSCICFDGRIDDAKIMLVCGDEQFSGPIKRNIIVSVRNQWEVSFPLVPDKAAAEKKHAEAIAETSVNWLVQKGWTVLP